MKNCNDKSIVINLNKVEEKKCYLPKVFKKEHGNAHRQKNAFYLKDIHKSVAKRCKVKFNAIGVNTDFKITCLTNTFKSEKIK